MTVTCNKCGVSVFLMGQWDESIEETYMCMRCTEEMMHETTATIESMDQHYRKNEDGDVYVQYTYTNEFDDLDILIRLNINSGTFHTRQVKNGQLLAMEVW